jgi:hypothetical protein
MKTKIVMVMSIAGVLVAGSAAALVNTQVLDSSASSRPPASVDLAATRQSTPESTDASVVSTSVAGNPAVQTSVPSSASVATQAVYSIGNSGTVTLDTAGDVLTIVGVTPADGWVVTKSETQDKTNVEVKLQAGSVEVEFHANLLFGVVTTSFESDDNSVTDSSVTGSSVEDNHGGGDDNGGPGGDDDSGHSGDDNSGHGGGGDDD